METRTFKNSGYPTERTPLFPKTAETEIGGNGGSSKKYYTAETGSSEPVTLALHNLCYTVRYRSGNWWTSCCRHKQVKRVLHDVTLALPAGQLVGIIGSSGSGKTSLLDVIAFRSQGEVTGTMMYGGQPCTKRSMRQRVSYVIQADRLLPNLTVRETLTYTAYLKLPSSHSKRQIEDKVSSVLNHMGLMAVADSRVGGAVVRGVSGGEKRRVTIALQLLKDPDILLMDEPTTGLDSFTARHLVASMQQLAREGKLVIMSLHQPRSDITRLLDMTTLMCQGHVMYFGPTSSLVPYFTGLGYPCSVFSNPLDVYMDLVGIDRRDPERLEETKQRMQELLAAYQSSDLLANTEEEVAEQLKLPSPITTRRFKSPGWFRTFTTVVGRMNLNLARDRLSCFNRVMMLPAFMPFLLAFLGRLQHNQRSIQDRIGLLYNSVQVPPYMAIMNNIACFPALRDHFYREGLDGLYGCQTFLLAYTVHILPFVAMASIIFSSLIYWVAGMYPDVDRFGMFLAVVFQLHLAGELLTAATMGLFRNSQLANTTTALLFTASGLIASGFLRSLENMQVYLQYLSWASIHKYASEIVVVNEFHNLNFTCDSQTQGSCIPYGDMYLSESYPGATDHLTRNFECLVGWLVFFQILSILSFKVFGLKALA
ncbi:ATP-binding cassette sub-family G member 5-like [Babylonia areolata]|uniref:ATP-binding cassette sub-family G member 5-like n=1 Tax=Babylonia areolata TaxID=304850 RepID=UPI003FD48A6D